MQGIVDLLLHKYCCVPGSPLLARFRFVQSLRSDHILTSTGLVQAVLKQFYGSPDNTLTDEFELQQHQKLEKLFISTRAAKHFQRDLVRGVEGYIVTGSKQVEIGTKLSEDSRKYGAENTCTSGNILSKASLNHARARSQIEKERGSLLKAFGTQVAEPLRAMVMGAPLEDARYLAQRYDKMRQEAEAQTIEVSRRQQKVREAPGNVDNSLKLEAAESKLEELKSNMSVLGKEAVSAMAAVETQQQRLSMQRLIAMIESERTFHQRVLQILEQLEGELVSERQRIEAPPAPTHVPETLMSPPKLFEENNGLFGSNPLNGSSDSMEYFIAEVMHSHQAETSVELSLSLGDYVVVRKEETPQVERQRTMQQDSQARMIGPEVVVPSAPSVTVVSSDGWAEGECKGKAGWFPAGYIQRRDRVLASKIAEVF